MQKRTKQLRKGTLKFTFTFFISRHFRVPDKSDTGECTLLSLNCATCSFQTQTRLYRNTNHIKANIWQIATIGELRILITGIFKMQGCRSILTLFQKLVCNMSFC